MCGVDGHYVIPCAFAFALFFFSTAEPCFPQFWFPPNVSSSACPSGVIGLVGEPCPCADGFFYYALVAAAKYETADNNSGRDGE